MRSKSDAIFRHLPGSVADFYGGRLIARVAKWTSRPIDIPGKRRVIERIHMSLGRFREIDPAFPSSPRADRYMFYEPNLVEIELFPLTLGLSSGKYLRFASTEQLLNYFRHSPKGEVGMQRDLVQVSTKGGMESLRVPDCPEHGLQAVILDDSSGDIGQFRWRCRLCNRALQGLEGFVDGQKIMGAVPVRSASVFIPWISTMVRVGIDIEELGDRKAADLLVLAKYLGFLDSKFDLKKGIASTSSRAIKPSSDTVEKFAKAHGLRPEEAESIIRDWEAQRRTPEEEAARGVQEVFPDPTNPRFGQAALSIFDYLETLNEGAISLSSAESQASGSAKDRFREFRSQFLSIGIEEVYHIPIVPLIQAAYGYTRGDFGPNNTTIRAFPPDGMDKTGQIPIYVDLTESEGLLLQLDRTRVLEWLARNKLVQGVDFRGTRERMLWFLTNVSPFAQTLPDSNQPFDTEIFTLLHTISHSLIKSITIPSGLASESIGELFFPNVPAILLYTHEGRGFKTGGMQDLFTNRMLTWLMLTKERLNPCIYDPVCLNSIGACHYCLLTTEATCSHFNSNLSRWVLFGNPQVGTLGYWSSAMIR